MESYDHLKGWDIKTNMSTQTRVHTKYNVYNDKVTIIYLFKPFSTLYKNPQKTG